MPLHPTLMKLRHHRSCCVRRVFSCPRRIFHRSELLFTLSFHNTKFLRCTELVAIMQEKLELVSVVIKRYHALLDFFIIISYLLLRDVIPNTLLLHLKAIILLRGKYFPLIRENIVQKIKFIYRIEDIHCIVFKLPTCIFLLAEFSFGVSDRMWLSVSEGEYASLLSWVCLFENSCIRALHSERLVTFVTNLQVTS